jgi:hypothetical protein
MAEAKKLRATADRLADAAAAAEEALEAVKPIKVWPMTPDTLMVYQARQDITQAKGALAFAAEVFAEAAEVEEAREAMTADVIEPEGTGLRWRTPDA